MFPLGVTCHHFVPTVLLPTPKFLCSPNRSLLPCALHLFCHLIYPRSTHARWVSWETLHSPPLQDVVIPRNICRFSWFLFPSLNLVTTQQLLLPQALSSRKIPLGKFHDSTKRRFSLTHCYFHTSIHLPMLLCIGSLCDFG